MPRRLKPYGRLVKHTIALPRFVVEELGASFRERIRDAAIAIAEAQKKAREELQIAGSAAAPDDAA